jgi:hypothetical protein
VVGIELVATGWLPRIAAAVAQSLLDVAVMPKVSGLARRK